MASALAIAALCFAGWLGWTRLFPPALPRDPGLSILLVSIDTLRADALGAYGNTRARTPLINRLAREGVRFDAAHAHNVVTLPSHVNILTGLLPFEHGVRDNNGFRVPKNVKTLASGFDRWDSRVAGGEFALPPLLLEEAERWLKLDLRPGKAASPGAETPFHLGAKAFVPRTSFEVRPGLRERLVLIVWDPRQKGDPAADIEIRSSLTASDGLAVQAGRLSVERVRRRGRPAYLRLQLPARGRPARQLHAADRPRRERQLRSVVRAAALPDARHGQSSRSRRPPGSWPRKRGRAVEERQVAARLGGASSSSLASARPAARCGARPPGTRRQLRPPRRRRGRRHPASRSGSR